MGGAPSARRYGVSMTSPAQPPAVRGSAAFGGLALEGVVEHRDLTASHATLERGTWVLVGDFEGRVHAWRFERTAVASGPRRPWLGPSPDAWVSSLDRSAYQEGVAAVRGAIREGDVYQVNLCRVLAARLTPAGGGEPDAASLAERLAAGNPAPYAGRVHIPSGQQVPGAWVVTASPELFLRVEDGVLTSGPIKGTAVEPSGLTPKDAAENVMITDMVRNDLQQVCVPGTVEVVDLLALERHPGLVHLVSRVQGTLVDPRPDWAAVLAATYPPASVSGAPKRAALEIISRLEPVPRGPYCGLVGWVDADAGRAELAVGIRTFWWAPQDGGVLRFGTGAGITWGSDPAREWDETELKAARLVALASTGPGPRRPHDELDDGPGCPRTEGVL